MKDENPRYIAKLDDFYTTFKDESPLFYKLLSDNRCWFGENIRFEMKSGKASYRDLYSVLAQDPFSKGQKDFIYPIIDRMFTATKEIIRHPQTTIVREHPILPVHAVRNTDYVSIQWLSTKPGRTVAEKLKMTRKIKGVRRYFSHDNSENQLFKELMKKLQKLLGARSEAFNPNNSLSPFNQEKCENLLKRIRRWLRSDEALEISPYKVREPNNTLLHHKYYRKALDTYRMLKHLPQVVNKDIDNFVEHTILRIYWTIVSHLYQHPDIYIPQQALNMNYDDFSIEPLLPIIFIHKDNKIEITYDKTELTILYQDKTISIKGENKGAESLILIDGKKFNLFDPLQDILGTTLSILVPEPFKEEKLKTEDSLDIVIDFTRYQYIVEDSIKNIPYRFWHQQWKNISTEQEYSIPCSHLKSALYLKAPDWDILNVSLKSFLYSDTLDKKDTYELGQYFISILKGYFVSAKNVSYIIPDHFHDFIGSIKSLKQHFRSQFTQSIPTPQSISAIMNITEYPHDLILVMQLIDKGLAITPIERKEDKDLAIISEKYRWERHPSFIIAREEILEPIYKDLEKKHSITREQAIDIYTLTDSLEGLVLIGDQEKIISYDKKMKPKEILIDEDIEGLIKKKLSQTLKKREFCILPISSGIKNKLPKKNLTKVPNILKGGQKLVNKQNELYQKNPELSLWKDHLPPLYMLLDEKNNEKVNLVEGVTIIPLYDKEQPISNKHIWTLPKNKKFYRFKLELENMGNTKYYALMESPQFPLNKDTTCTLELSYTYGTSDPYTLKFIPEDKTLPAFPVRWVFREEDLPPIDLDSLTKPIYPPVKNLESFESDKTDEMQNLYEELRKILDEQPKPSKILKLKFRIRVLCYNIFREGLNLENSPPKYISILRDFKDFIEGEYEKNIEVNQGFQDPLDKEYIKRDKENQEHFLRLSLMHSSCSKPISQELIQYSKELPPRKRSNTDGSICVAYAIGTGEKEWQKEIVFNLLEQLKDILKSSSEELSEELKEKSLTIMEIFSIALWRVDSFIDFQDEGLRSINESANPMLDLLLDACVLTLSFGKPNVSIQENTDDLAKKKPDGFDKTIYYNMFNTFICELLLGLLRLRSDKNIEVKKMLSPEHPRMKGIIEYIDKLTLEDMYKDIKKGYTSKIQLEDDKYILDALKEYLEGIGSPKIKEVND